MFVNRANQVSNRVLDIVKKANYFMLSLIANGTVIVNRFLFEEESI